MEQTVCSWLPVAAVLVPLAASPLIYLAGCWSWQARNLLSVVTGAACAALVAAMYPIIAAGGVIAVSFPALVPPLGISFRVDALSFLVAALAAFIWLMATIYSLDYMAHEHRKKRFYSCLILSLSGCLGVLTAGDLFTLFLFFELMSLSAYVLVIHEEIKEAMRAGYKYLVMTIVGGLAVFMGLAVVYSQAGTLAFGQGGLVAAAGPIELLGFIGFLIGFGIKAGMVPLHVWLPDAHPVAPSPASALLSGLMIKTGAYGLIRVVYDVYGADLVGAAGWNQVIVGLAVVTIILGSAMALVQDDLKRRLAYSSVGQMGYILLGIGLLSPGTLLGGVFHIFAHAFMKSTLFLSAGAVIYGSGTRSIRELGGIGLRMPVTMGAFTLAALGMIGVPPLNAFLSKWQLAMGALALDQPLYVGLLLLSSLMNMAYYMPIVIAGFFGPQLEERDFIRHDAPVLMLGAIVVLALGNVVFSLLPVNLPLSLAELATRLFYP